MLLVSKAADHSLLSKSKRTSKEKPTLAGTWRIFLENANGIRK